MKRILLVSALFFMPTIKPGEDSPSLSDDRIHGNLMNFITLQLSEKDNTSFYEKFPQFNTELNKHKAAELMRYSHSLLYSVHILIELFEAQQKRINNLEKATSFLLLTMESEV